MNMSGSAFGPSSRQDGCGCDGSCGDHRAENRPQKVQVIAVGSVPAVEEFVMRMYHIRFANPYEWTPPQPSPSNPDHIMRTVIKPITISSP
ncbi:MAG: hypothetical protein WBA57_06775 [Elainellaceae cyanobacterium]